MRIGCDLDGVIIDHRNIQCELLQKFGFAVPKEHITKEKIKTLLSENHYKAFKDQIYGPLSLRSEEISEAKEAIAALSSLGHQVRIISRREQGSAFAKQWLKEHGFSKLFPESMIHFVKNDIEKETVCKEHGVGLHIDDSPNILEILKTPRHRILLSRDGTPHPAATFTAPSWHSILAHIKTLV